jgi:hypothetical protein
MTVPAWYLDDLLLLWFNDELAKSRRELSAFLWPKTAFILSRSRDLSAPSSHFEYTLNNICALTRPICCATQEGLAPAIKAIAP